MDRRNPINLKARTRKLWIERGYHVANAESHFNGISFDMFNIADLFAFKAADGLSSNIFIQVGRWADRAAKIDALNHNPVAEDWLKCGNRIVLSLWRYKSKPGKRRTGFELREEDFTG